MENLQELKIKINDFYHELNIMDLNDVNNDLNDIENRIRLFLDDIYIIPLCNFDNYEREIIDYLKVLNDGNFEKNLKNKKNRNKFLKIYHHIMDIIT